MGNLTGINVQKGSAAEKIWWGLILTLLPPLTIIGLPMLIAGISQATGRDSRLQVDSAEQRQRASTGRKWASSARARIIGVCLTALSIGGATLIDRTLGLATAFA